MTGQRKAIAALLELGVHIDAVDSEGSLENHTEVSALQARLAELARARPESSGASSLAPGLLLPPETN